MSRQPDLPVGQTGAQPAESVWLDALAFLFGLGLAWWWEWNSSDLVWSLWLSSLVVGYALILWGLSRPLREIVHGIATDRDNQTKALGAKVAVVGLMGLGTLLGVAFFTVHFGGFHFVHSVFLNTFFPVAGDVPEVKGAPTAGVYFEVLRRYWWFLPAAFLAERAAFRTPPSASSDTSVSPQAIARRKAKGDALMAPYKNVIRMHLLIFFFAGAHALELENFAVYAVVFAVYFFPWRVLRRAEARS